MPFSYLAFLRDDFRMSTWLLVGAAFQGALCLVLPTYLAYLPTFLILASRVTVYITTNYGITHNSSMDRVVIGRQTAQIPNENGSYPEKGAEKELTVLILGARSNQ